MNATLIVFVGAGLGGALRHLFAAALTRTVDTTFPLAILAINVVGSLAMGLIVGWFAFADAGGASQPTRLFLTTGLLGGFTTFSAFSLDAVLLMQRGEWTAFALYALGSVALSIGACIAGLWLMRSFT